MKTKWTIGVALLGWLISAGLAAAATAPTEAELAKTRKWASTHFESGDQPFFAFKVGDQASAELLKKCTVNRAHRRSTNIAPNSPRLIPMPLPAW